MPNSKKSNVNEHLLHYLTNTTPYQRIKRLEEMRKFVFQLHGAEAFQNPLVIKKK